MNFLFKYQNNTLVNGRLQMWQINKYGMISLTIQINVNPQIATTKVNTTFCYHEKQIASLKREFHNFTIKMQSKQQFTLFSYPASVTTFLWKENCSLHFCYDEKHIASLKREFHNFTSTIKMHSKKQFTSFSYLASVTTFV